METRTDHKNREAIEKIINEKLAAESKRKEKKKQRRQKKKKQQEEKTDSKSEFIEIPLSEINPLHGQVSKEFKDITPKDIEDASRHELFVWHQQSTAQLEKMQQHANELAETKPNEPETQLALEVMTNSLIYAAQMSEKLAQKSQGVNLAKESVSTDDSLESNTPKKKKPKKLKKKKPKGSNENAEDDFLARRKMREQEVVLLDNSNTLQSKLSDTEYEVSLIKKELDEINVQIKKDEESLREQCRHVHVLERDEEYYKNVSMLFSKTELVYLYYQCTFLQDSLTEKRKKFERTSHSFLDNLNMKIRRILDSLYGDKKETATYFKAMLSEGKLWLQLQNKYYNPIKNLVMPEANFTVNQSTLSEGICYLFGITFSPRLMPKFCPTAKATCKREGLFQLKVKLPRGAMLEVGKDIDHKFILIVDSLYNICHALGYFLPDSFYFNEDQSGVDRLNILSLRQLCAHAQGQDVAECLNIYLEEKHKDVSGPFDCLGMIHVKRGVNAGQSIGDSRDELYIGIKQSYLGQVNAKKLPNFQCSSVFSDYFQSRITPKQFQDMFSLPKDNGFVNFLKILTGECKVELGFVKDLISTKIEGYLPVWLVISPAALEIIAKKVTKFKNNPEEKKDNKENKPKTIYDSPSSPALFAPTTVEKKEDGQESGLTMLKYE